MGQSASQTSRSARTLSRRDSHAHASAVDAPGSTRWALGAIDDLGERDCTVDIPDECLALVFQSLGAGDRKRCSLVCRRWLVVDGQSRHRLSLDARAALFGAAPGILARFDSVSKLSLNCDRHSVSIGDEALALIASRCPRLIRLKLRACREVSERGMAALSAHCSGLRKLSCGSCAFGTKGIEAVLRGCPNLEELSIKHLRGPTEAADLVVPGGAAASLRSICLKEIYNGQCFGPLIACAKNLRTLKLFRCSGDWDQILQEIAGRVPVLMEVHLEKLQVGDEGLAALAACAELEVLHLVKTPECTDAGLAAIAERCRLLRKIHIDGWKTNRIGDEGLAAVAHRCPNLQELVLIGVNPTAVSLSLIASNCRSLERLALCSSETFGDNEISCIAAKCAALKKLCIKGCPVSDTGMGALAEGCPNLVKVKVKKCKNVTPYCADWLRTARGSLAVNLDTVGPVEPQDVSISDGRVLESGPDELSALVDQITAIGIPSSSTGCSVLSKARMGLLASRNFMASTFRRWCSHGSGSMHHT